MRGTKFVVWCALVALYGLVGCGGSTATCTPGMSVECACRDGRRGAQECNAEGTFEMCICEGGLDAGPPDGEEDSGTAVDDAGVTTSPDASAEHDAGSDDDDAGSEDLDSGAPVVDVVALDAGNESTCVAMRDGSVICWGRAFTPTPAPMIGPLAAVDVGPGQDHACFVEATGDVGCLGNNEENQLGHSNDEPSSETAVSASGLTDALTITAGRFHTCALRAGGLVSCWGDRRWGQTGTSIESGFGGNNRAPALVDGITGVTQLEAGSSHNCALLDSGSVACWGRNDSYALGNGDTDDSATPVPVIGLADAVHIAVATSRACAARSDGTVACWGGGSALLQSVTGVDDAVEVAVGNSHACARSASGLVRCWGSNNNGQLGNGGSEASTEPVEVTDIDDALMLAAGDDHTCAVRASGTVVCWGENNEGQLGDGSTLTRRVPVMVALP